MRAYSDAPSVGGRKPSVAKVTDRLKAFIDSDNIAADLEDDELGKIGSKVLAEFQIDYQSNSEWMEAARKALDAALQVPEAKNVPWPNASNVKWPLVTVAALQFNARAYPAIVDTDQIVKAKVVGSDDGIPKTGPDGQPMPVMGPDGQPVVGPDGQPQIDWEKEPGAKREQADRISRHMSYQLGEEMEEWEEDTDVLLMQLPIVGTAFRKVYYDPVLSRNRSEMVAGTDYVVHRSTRSLESVPRGTHCFKRYPIEIEEKVRAGIWLDCDLAPSTADNDGTEDAPHEFLEQHRYIDLDGDGYREPYIVTVHKDSGKVVRIVANYGLTDIKMGADKVERIQRRDYFVKYGFIPDPKGGFYDIGFGLLLGSLSASIDTTINQMLDAGTIQNAGGGLIGAGLRFKKGTIQMVPGRYQTVDSPGGKVREAIYNWEHPGPSAVLFSLLGMLISAAKDITSVQDLVTGDSGNKVQQPTTVIALIEQGLKVFTAIFKRIYRSLKQEFKLLRRLNAENLPEQSYFMVLDEPQAIARSDYDNDNYDVCPVADPRNATDIQRMMRAQTLMPFMEAMDPLFDQIELRRRFLVATGHEDIEALLAKPQPPDPMMVAGAEAEVRKTNATAAKDETQAMLNVSKIEGDQQNREMAEAGQALDAMKMGEGRRQFDESAAANERRAAEQRQRPAA